MLKAINKMLSDSKDPEVKCAKIMLDEIINGLEGGFKFPKPLQDILDDEKDKPATATEVAKPKPPKPMIKKPEKGQVKIEVGPDRRLTRVEGAEMDDKIMLDNKIMTVREAIGKTFNEARVL